MTRNRHKKLPIVEQRQNDLEKLAPKTRDSNIRIGDTERIISTPVRIRYKPVCWGIPMDEICYSLWFSNFVHLPIMPWDSIAVSISTYLMDARNFIHANFVRNIKDTEWLIMLDSDVLPPPDFLEKLLAHKKKMIGGWYRKKGGGVLPVVYDNGGVDENNNIKWIERKEPGKGVERVDCAGAGCWLMHRDVAEAIGETPYTRNVGEDLELCEKVTRAGFEIFIDWSIACAHAGVAFV